MKRGSARFDGDTLVYRRNCMAEVASSGRLCTAYVYCDCIYPLVLRTSRLADSPIYLDWQRHDWIRREEVLDTSYAHE